MLDKIIIRLMLVVLIVFVLLAVFYQRPDSTKQQRADYLPDEGFVAKRETGQFLFNQNCISCHGKALEGTNSGPPLIHAYYKPEHHGDLSIYLAVYQGVTQHHWQFGNMPAMKHLSAEDAGHLLVFIREEQKRAGLF